MKIYFLIITKRGTSAAQKSSQILAGRGRNKTIQSNLFLQTAVRSHTARELTSPVLQLEEYLEIPAMGFSTSHYHWTGKWAKESSRVC